jgi:hypothetical protein
LFPCVFAAIIILALILYLQTPLPNGSRDAPNLATRNRTDE